MSPGDRNAPRRGEVWWIAFDPSVGGEIKKTRPAVIVSNDIANRVLNRVQVVPVTRSVSRLYSAEAFVTINGAKSKAMADQIATASKEPPASEGWKDRPRGIHRSGTRDQDSTRGLPELSRSLTITNPITGS